MALPRIFCDLDADDPALLIACRLRVRGIVQGVGFRPHVWRLAHELGLAGWVRNDAAGVDIALSGRSEVIERFVERLSQEAPRLARIDAIERHDGPYSAHSQYSAGFQILDSQAGEVQTAIGPDSTVCADCLGEIFDPGHRRYRYAFTTCTHCGPRYTIARGLPYDRASTSLAPFPLCPACAAEYADPGDRRFHAEATCCPVCGPQLDLRTINGDVIAGDPLAETLRLLRAGSIVAIKGLGGFHLACDARNAEAVATLRQRKAREAKPLAVMVASPAVLASYASATSAELALLSSAAAPVVLLAQTAACPVDLPGIAPAVGTLGAMLPNTPLQWLLFHEAAGRPAGTDWIAAAPPDLILVMTSANPQGEPLVITDAEAFERLAGIADAVLGHNRAIVARADDSVIRSGVFIRRGRGYTPQAIKLAEPGPSVLAFGGWFKNTICLTRGDEAFVSTHIGDLDNAASCRFLDETVDRMLALTGIEPQLVAHDRHPDFYSTRAAQAFAAQRGLPAIAIQHHHAHLAAVAAEHGIVGPTPGLALDGVGLGDDAGDGVTAWGGELLAIDGAHFERLGHLAPLALPGGDRAAREPWRMGAAALWALGRGDEIIQRYADQPAAATVRQMLERRLNCPLSSSAGRLFDAAAGLLGIQPVAQFEAQAAMALEALATAYDGSDGSNEMPAAGWTLRDGVLDFLPLLQRLADEKNAARGAALFHEILAAGLIALVCDRGAANAAPGGGKLLVAGGCALNRRLMDKLRRGLDRAGVQMIEAQAVPPGDGGLSLGQAWVAQRSKV